MVTGTSPRMAKSSATRRLDGGIRYLQLWGGGAGGGSAGLWECRALPISKVFVGAGCRVAA